MDVCSRLDAVCAAVNPLLRSLGMHDMANGVDWIVYVVLVVVGQVVRQLVLQLWGSGRLCP